MAIRPIVDYPAAVLLKPGNPVESFDGDLESLVQDMFDTMYDAGGVGLAAQQIGVSLRLFVMDCDGIKLVAANLIPSQSITNKRSDTPICCAASPTPPASYIVSNMSWTRDSRSPSKLSTGLPGFRSTAAG